MDAQHNFNYGGTKSFLQLDYHSSFKDSKVYEIKQNSGTSKKPKKHTFFFT